MEEEEEEEQKCKAINNMWEVLDRREASEDTLIPLFPLIRKEFQYLGSLWGNYNELREIMELATKGLIKNNVQKLNLSEVNDALDLLREGNIQGRGVLIP